MDAFIKRFAASILLVMSAPTMAGDSGANIPPPPPPPVSVDSAENEWMAREAETFDLVRADPSPRVQVLAADAYLGEAYRPLRPKPDEVVARAAKLAPDDAFVQWVAARDGRYQPSSCGPVVLPVDEVSNLLRLEPDNAAAWTFAVALAAATGDEDGVDSALSRMATAARADDHFIEHWQAWDALYAAHPELRHDAFEATPGSQRATMESFVKARGGTGEAAGVVKRACTSEAGERTWQRLGWCAEAARVLAREGGSVELRNEGIDLLEAIGDRSVETARLRRENQWWSEQRGALFAALNGAAGPDWKGAPTQIEAIGQALVRKGEPTTVPEGWESESAAREERAVETQSAYVTYLRMLADSLRTDADPRFRALAFTLDNVTASMPGIGTSAQEPERSKDVPAAMAGLAAAHPDNVLVQWIAATVDGETDADALANLQRLEPDNAAVWGLVLAASSNDAASASESLQRMAASPRVDFHYVELFSAWVDAVRATPPSADLLDRMRGGPPSATDAPAPEQMVSGLSYAAFGSVPTALTRACEAKNAEAGRTAACVSVARTLLHSDESLLMATVGSELLGKLGASEAHDLERMRRLDWWRSMMMEGGPLDMKAYVDDLVGSGREIEALRRLADRAGKAEPPVDWRAPAY